MIYIDDAFADIERIRAHAVAASYGTMDGPDGAAYENMSFDIPEWLGASLYTRIYELVGPVEPYTIFFRANLRTSKIPHWAHTDTRLCDALALLYLTRDVPADKLCGTAVVEHVTGLARHPETPAEFELWKRDHSDYAKWRIVDYAPMKYNRLIFIPADLLHAALPPGGFGDTIEDGRLVLVTFFKRIKV